MLEALRALMQDSGNEEHMTRDKNKPPRTFPRWLSWVILLFLGYILYEGNVVAPHRAEKIATPLAPTREYPQLRTVADADRWKRAINPDYVGNVKTQDIAQGEGEGARCGEEITVTLRGTTSEGANFEPEHKDDAKLNFRLGEAPYAALDNALIGLKPGGKRRVDAPPQLVYKDHAHKTSDTILLYIARVDTPKPPATDQLPLQAVDNVSGNGPGAACGETIPVTLKVWSEKGEVAFGSGSPLNVKLGDGQFAYGLDAALVGLAEGGTRTVILPPAALQGASARDASWKQWIEATSRGRVMIVSVTRLAPETIAPQSGKKNAGTNPGKL